MMYATSNALVQPERYPLFQLDEKSSSYIKLHVNRMPKIGKYIDFKSDFGIKHLLGKPSCKGRLQALLNALSDNLQKAGKLHYLNTEILGTTSSNRKAIFDILCEDKFSNAYIVEMQKAKQEFFIDRSFVYQSLFISNTIPRGPWNFNLQTITMICFLNFTLREDVPYYVHPVVEMYCKDSKPTNDKFLKIFIELGKFNKSLDELETPEDMWLFLIKNLSTLKKMPKQFDNDLFRPIFEDAEFSKLNNKNKMLYKNEQEMSWDEYANLTTAVNDAVNDAKRELIVDLLKSNKLSIKEIARITKMPQLMVIEISKSLTK